MAADLPGTDLMTDEAQPFRQRGQNRLYQPPFATNDKQISLMEEERIDSGLGYSLESQDLSYNSLGATREDTVGLRFSNEKVAIDKVRSSSDNFTSGLHNQLRNLSLRDSDNSKGSITPNRCDSGICDSGNFSVEEPILQAGFSECHLTSHSGGLYEIDNSFSAQELDELYSQDEDGDTHLHMSIIHLLPEVTERIIALAPNHNLVNISNCLHQTPLHLAVATQQLLVARRLMVAGAIMDAPDHCGNTPLHMACREGMYEMVQFLLTPVQHQETLTNVFHIPAQRVPQDLSIKNYDGYTCAHLALQGGHLHILRLLLLRGADVNEPDGKSGRTLLHMAAELGQLGALQLLLNHKQLDINALTYGGLSAVSLAHGRRLTNVVELLFQCGADCSHLTEDCVESSDEEMNDCVYDDICINGQPVLFA